MSTLYTNISSYSSSSSQNNVPSNEKSMEISKSNEKSLTSSSSANSKPKAKPNFDMIHSMEYRNRLPQVPCGPYFIENLRGVNEDNSNQNSNNNHKTTFLYHTFEQFGEYKPSTLEKNYLWQPHLDITSAMQVDLVDQEGMLYLPDHSKLEPIDELYLKPHPNDRVGSKRSSKLEEFSSQLAKSNTWWLRNTTYLENNLFSHTHKTRQDTIADLKKRKLSKIEHEVDDKYSHLDSFQAVELKTQELIEKAKKRGVTLEWCVDVLPNTLLEGQTISLLRYDEPPLLPSKLLSEKRIHDLLKHSVVTNIRNLQTMKLSKSTAFECSLIVPQYSLSSSSSSSSSNQENEQDQRQDQDQQQMEYVKDYIMDSVIGQKEDESYMLTFTLPTKAVATTTTTTDDDNDNNNSNHEKSIEDIQNAKVRGIASYYPIKSRINMHKLAKEESQPVNVVITHIEK